MSKRVRKSNAKGTGKVVMVYRKSTDEDSKQQNSIEMQRDNAVSFCTKEGLSIVSERIEHLSGTVPLSQSDALRGALEDAVTHGAEFIGFDKFDRCARNISRYFHFKSLCQEIGVKVLIISEGFKKEEDEKFSSLTEIFQLFSAENTAKVLRERVKQGMMVKKQKKEKYCKDAGWGWKFEDGKLVENHEESALIRRIKDMSLNGLSTVAIAKTLSGEGYKNRNGSDFTPMTIWRIVKSA